MLKDIAAEIRYAFTCTGFNEEIRLSPSNRPDLADYMCDAALGASKVLKRAPSTIAQDVVNMLSQDGYKASVVSGYVNIRLDSSSIAKALDSDTVDGFSETGEIYIIDSGGPNTAKPMHVGHLRSLVIGDALARIFRYLGHTVIKDVHFGDWGYQMGLMLAALPIIPNDMSEIEAMYPIAAQQAKNDPDFKKAAHHATIALQNGDEEHLVRWKTLREISNAFVFADLDALGISFDLLLGESDSMPSVPFVELILNESLTDSDGATIVETENGALMFRNSEGGYLYAATDLATIVQRDEFIGKDRSYTTLYVVDERQSLHFKQVFEVAKSFSPSRLEHISFGTVNGPDGKPFKTREGGVPRLSDLMREAIEKASERNPEGARKIAMAALKFGDLINRRTSNYPFDLNKALKFEGKTGPYMLYQIVRIKSIIDQAMVEAGDILINDDDERALALHMLEFNTVIEKAAMARMPHLVAEYAYELSQRFSRFYTGDSIKDNPSRLGLAKHTLDRLGVLMRLLGIETVDKM